MIAQQFWMHTLRLTQPGSWQEIKSALAELMSALEDLPSPVQRLQGCKLCTHVGASSSC